MTNCPEKESASQNEVPGANPFMSNLDRLKLELSLINEGIQSFARGERMMENWGPARYLRDEDEDDDTDSNRSENYSMFNSTDGDDDSQCLLRCHFCEFDIEVPVHRSHLEDVHCYDPKNMVCPVCDENLGEDAIRAAQNSNLRRKRAWKSEKSSISSGNSAILDRKFVVWGNRYETNRHESMSDQLLSPFIGNVSVPSPSDVQSDDDSISNASDISNAKSCSGTDVPDTPDTGEEQDRQERSLRASFVQDLVLSTLSLEM